jgi:hypothetical protein
MQAPFRKFARIHPTEELVPQDDVQLAEYASLSLNPGDPLTAVVDLLSDFGTSAVYARNQYANNLQAGRA